MAGVIVLRMRGSAVSDVELMCAGAARWRILHPVAAEPSRKAEWQVCQRGHMVFRKQPPGHAEFSDSFWGGSVIMQQALGCMGILSQLAG